MEPPTPELSGKEVDFASLSTILITKPEVQTALGHDYVRLDSPKYHPENLRALVAALRAHRPDVADRRPVDPDFHLFNRAGSELHIATVGGDEENHPIRVAAEAVGATVTTYNLGDIAEVVGAMALNPGLKDAGHHAIYLHVNPDIAEAIVPPTAVSVLGISMHHPGSI